MKVQIENIDVRSDYEKWLGEELYKAKFARLRWEEEWAKNEMSLFDNGDATATRQSIGSQSGSADSIPESSSDAADNFMALNLNARNAALIQSQLISNVPAIMTLPANNKDRNDREAALGHERALQYLREEKDWGIQIGLAMGHLTTYGTAYVKQIMDAAAGGYDYDNEGKVVPIGDVVVSIPNVYDIWLDSEATNEKEITKIWERLHFDFESAKSYFGEAEAQKLAGHAPGAVMLEGSQLPVFFHGKVEVYELWIAGCAADNYKGALVYHTEDGTLLKKIENPCKFNMFPKVKSKSKVKVARLPYSVMTYDNVPGSPYGRSPAARCYKAQAILNQCAAVVLQTAKNVGVPKVMTSANVVNQSSFTDDSMQIIQLDITGSEGGGGGSFPAVFQAANTSNDIKYVIDEQKNHINEQWGINDALIGKQGRETQGVTMQTSIQQSNLIREWLFDKYVKFIKDLASLQLAYAVDYWPESKWKLVLGNEDSPTLLKASMQADVESGYSIMLERNMLIALDPISRQEQLLRLKDVLMESGMDKRYYITLFRLADFRGLYSQFEYADNRGKRNLDFIIENKELPKIYKHEDHTGISAYLMKFINSFEFEELEEDVKVLINTLVDKRLELEAQKSVGQAPPPGAAPAGLPGGMVPPGM